MVMAKEITVHPHMDRTALSRLSFRINRIFKVDPSRVSGIQSRFIREINRRFGQLKSDIKKSIIDQDCFGILPRVSVLSPTGEKAFAFERSAEKVGKFMDWLQRQAELHILTGGERGVRIVIRPGIHPGIEPQWTDVFIDSAYAQGIRRARAELKRAGYEIPSFEGVPGGIGALMNQPFHADRIGLIYSRTYEDLKTVTQFMNAEVRRTISDGLTTGLARGLAEGKNPLVIARELMKDVANGVDKIGITRARLIARTEVMRAHHQANIAEYRAAAADMDVTVDAEFLTAADPCDECADLAGAGPYTLDEIEGMIPVHPNSYAVGTEIYTDHGFIPVEKIKIGDKCLSLCPTTFDLEYVPVVGTFAHKEDTMVHFLSRTFDMLVTKDHQMFTLRRERKWTAPRSWEFIEATKVPKESMFYRSSKWTGNSNPKIIINGIKFETELFAEFMGWWLSDGTLGRREIAVCQSQTANPDKFERIIEICSAISKISICKDRIIFWNDQLYAYLLSLGKQPVRFIPLEIKSLSPTYLRIFLDAFVAGDGHRRVPKPWKGGNFASEITYTTSSKRMADDLGECILKVGHCPSFYLYPSKGKIVHHKSGDYVGNVDMWYVRECRTQMARLECGVKRSIVDYDEMAYCVELERFHTLWVRRNGKTGWSGNCRCVAKPVPLSEEVK